MSRTKKIVPLFIFLAYCLLSAAFVTLSGVEGFSQGTWNAKSSFSTNRCLVTAFAIGNKGYIGTGSNPSGASTNIDFWEYNPVTDVWTQMADFSGGARRGAVSFSANSKGYIGLGLGGGNYYKDLWEYNPAGNSWIQRANFPGQGRFRPSAFSIGSKGYVGTGFDQNNIYYDDFWEYDASANVWTARADFPGGMRVGGVGFSIAG